MQLRDFRAGEVVLIHKPLKWTSFQVVNKMKWLLRKYEVRIQKTKEVQFQATSNSFTLSGVEGQQQTIHSKLKIGHAGTLDPLATGLLIVCTGKQTKNIEQYQAQEKEYTGTFYIGATTPCFDLEKEIDAHFPTEHITEELILQTTKQFLGTIQQTPPLFSAIKIDGKRAYDIARAGKTAEIKAKEITISEFEITRIALPEVDFRVVCSKGTYIRSLARDFGLALNSGAHLTALNRTRIGEYKLSDAMSVEEFERWLEE
jgi:tRNA pseudouridine55 synthase